MLTVQYTRVTGDCRTGIELSQDKVNFISNIKKNIKDRLKMIRCMDMEFTTMHVERSIQENGQTEKQMEK